MLEVRLAEQIPDAEALAIPVIPAEDAPPGCGGAADRLPGDVAALLADAGNTGAAGTVTSLPMPGQSPMVAYLVGIGAATPADLRAAGAAVVRAATPRAATPRAAAPRAGAEDGGPRQLRHLAATLEAGTAAEAVEAFVEGAVLASYRFSMRSTPPPALQRLTVVVDRVEPYRDALDRALARAGATHTARDLINTPASVKSPQWLAERAEEWLTPLGVTVTVGDEVALAERGFGGLLAVGGGSSQPPRLIEARWQPPGSQDAAPVVLVGKGITFDTGGISVKPAEAMLQMHTDMAGAATVLGALAGAARLRLPVPVVALVPAAENALSGSAYRPGDVIRHYGGRTTEVGNTDAEGRLVLADALAYAAAELAPRYLVDVATLTGAARIALGVRTGALFSDGDALAAELVAAAERAGEQLWRLPLPADYEPLLASQIADSTNAAGNPGAITAALFLKPFAAGRAWAHLDIAGAARASGDSGVISRGGTGYGVRTLLTWLSGLSLSGVSESSGADVGAGAEAPAASR